MNKLLILIIIYYLIILQVLSKSNNKKNDIDKDGLKSNKKYITYFALFTFIPSLLISIFSLFLFYFNNLIKFISPRFPYYHRF